MSEKWNSLCIVLGGIASLLIILGFFGVDVALLKRISQEMKMQYILLTIGLLISLSVLGAGLYSKLSSSKITPVNIEPSIRQWLDAFGLGTKKLSEPSCFFAYEVTLQTGIPIVVLRTRQHPHYITLASKIGFGPEHKAEYDKLSELGKQQFMRRLRLEAVKVKTAYSFDANVDTLMIERRLPITNNFSEADLIDGLSEINFSAIIVLDTMVSELELDAKQPSSTPDKGASPH